MHRSCGTRWQLPEPCCEEKGAYTDAANVLFLPGLDRNGQALELETSKLTLTRITGKEPYVICYPAGNTNADTEELAAEHYRLGVDMGNFWYTTGENPYQIRRLYVPRSLSLGAFKQLVQ